MGRLTKGTIEAEISNTVVRFQREQLGRGPTEVRAYLLGDMILVRSGGIFTPMEARLAGSEEGRHQIKSARHELRAIIRSEIEAIIGQIVGIAVLRSYCDVDVNAAEQMEVYVLETDLEKRLLRQDLDNFSGLTAKRHAP